MFELEHFIKRQGLENHSTYRLFKTVENFAPIFWLAGGSALALVTNKEVTSDYDFYFSKMAHLDEFANNLVDVLGAVEVANTKNAETYNVPIFGKVQLIKRVMKNTAGGIFDTFDITLSMMAVEKVDTLAPIICFDVEALIDLANKEIRIHNPTYIGNTVQRVIKYGARGYKIPKETYQRLFELFATNTTSQEDEAPARLDIPAMGAVINRAMATVTDSGSHYGSAQTTTG